VRDLVDGGPFGVGALRYARDRPNSTVLLGNHEVLMLAALRDRERYVFWAGNGGQPHDLEELRRDAAPQDWLRTRAAIARLEDGTLDQQYDNDGLGRFGSDLEQVNQAVNRLLESGDTIPLWDAMTPQNVFRTQPLRLEGWLQRMDARRLVHGHTPHSRPRPDVYAGGAAICFDGGLGRFGHARHLRASPLGASVGPLPPV